MKEQIKVIAFDADDTLWENETYFRNSEEKFAMLLSDFMPPHDVNRALLRVEISNIPSLGYGVKSFIISMIEAAMEISDGRLHTDDIQRIIQIGKDQLAKPVHLIDGVQEVLNRLQRKYRLVMATKGDLKEQESKLIKSGLEAYFHHIEILSEKKEANYKKLISHLDVKPDQFLMIGNSLKSDIIPVLELGAYAVHVPFHTTWEYEKVESKIEHEKFSHIEDIKELLEILL
ncbi:HAD family hydrolase [Portibacter marinus]|uniref:HAD family hydrolase n=1 Tax=Portibacter marinus TaxID=2898660 RepID=UPI001F428D9B|nr:HAD family hydrolase [Portibacter marinus]